MRGNSNLPVVSAFSIDGLDIYFNSSDHNPPHIHVESASWHIRVFIDSSSVERGLHYKYKQPKYPPKNFQGITKKQRKLLLDKVVECRDILIMEWQEKVNVGDTI
jgi:hypothetical protein